MRVLLFSPHFAEYACRIAVALSSHCEVMLVLDGDNMRAECGEDLLSSAREKVRIETISKRSRVSQLLSAPEIVRLARSFRPDVVHFQEVPCFISDVLRRSVGKHANIVLTVHDPIPHSGSDASISARQKRFEGALRRRADLILVHGDYCRKLLAQEEPQHRGKVELTRHGVLAVPSIVPKVGVASRIALFLGRLEAYKGLDVLAHAAKELEAERPDVRFRVVGSGSELSNVLRAAKALTNLDVTAGYFSPDDAVRELQGAALVVAPYKDATQSGIVAAAFANGRPVVASKVGGLPEMIVDGVNGRLIPPEDPKSLARAVSELLSDSQALEAMSTAAARTAETALAWNGIAADTYQKYRVLASARQGSRN